MKNIITAFFILFTSLSLGQNSFLSTTGSIQFDASTPLEDISAVNKKVNFILKSDGEFASLLLVKEFNFKRELMEEHFNENYMESDRYPKAHFVGKISDFSLNQLSHIERTFNLSGTLTMHGVSRTFNTDVNLKKIDDMLFLESSFIVRPEEYKIKVPRILFKKIAEEVQVVIMTELLPE
jgi:hypothetical protein